VSWKEWYTAKSDRTCRYCNAMNGKVIDLQKTYFKVGDSFEVQWETIDLDYEDIAWPTLHPNCLCTLLPVIIK
jgi:hypothetical protein